MKSLYRIRYCTRTLQCLQKLQSIFGHRVYLVGGSVRDMVSGSAISDVDACLRMPPDIADAYLLRSGMPYRRSGTAHGGFTVIIDGKSVEITSTREDVSCDGRHARIRYTDRLSTDVRRRDFTVNAIYMSTSHTLIDHTSGINDIQRGILRFIGDPCRRCEEDVLRVWRYFRFSATLPFLKRTHTSSYHACIMHADNAANLPFERIAQECTKLYAGAARFHTLSAMRRHAALSNISGSHALPCLDTLSMPDILHRSYGRMLAIGRIPDSPELRTLSVLSATSGLSPEDALRPLILSKKTRASYMRILSSLPQGGHVAEADIAAYVDSPYPHEAALFIICSGMRAITYTDSDDVFYAVTRAFTLLHRMTAASIDFPIQAKDIIPLAPTPRDISRLLRITRDMWRASGFTLSRRELLAKIQIPIKNENGAD